MYERQHKLNTRTAGLPELARATGALVGPERATTTPVLVLGGLTTLGAIVWVLGVVLVLW